MQKQPRPEPADDPSSQAGRHGIPDTSRHAPGHPRLGRPDSHGRSGAGDSAVRRAVRILGRAVARRCPECGSSGIFRTYLHQRSSCPHCRLRLDRGEPDFFIGAYTVNLIVAELLVFFGGLGVMLWTWPEVPWNALMYGMAALMVAAPIILYPVSRQVWLALDLIFRPAEMAEFVPADP
jgi:uncharacterized protein (DUF983 family)